MARILIVDDDLSLREVMEITFVRKGHNVWSAANIEQAWKILTKRDLNIVLLDLRLGEENGLDLLARIKESFPDLPVIMITAHADTDSAVIAMKKGATDYLSKPFELDELLITIDKAMESSQLKEEIVILKKQLERKKQPVLGSSPIMEEVFGLVKKIAPTNINALILGESGTGKEVIARLIHDSSLRAGKPFMAINCGSIPDNLVESELFGYRKGAFTGADKNKRGLFEAGEGGTVFLDEVGELPPIVQVKLLRYLQEKIFTPIGSSEEISSDVRIISATNRLLESEVSDGVFREDLFYRLSGIILRLPPLRKRGADVLTLAEYFLQENCKEYNKHLKGFSDSARQKIISYHYPGNIRELQNVIARAVALESGLEISPESLIIYESAMTPTTNDTFGVHTVLTGAMNIEEYQLKIEYEILTEALKLSNGHKGKAAKMVGLNFRQFRYRLEKLGLAGANSDDEMD